MSHGHYEFLKFKSRYAFRRCLCNIIGFVLISFVALIAGLIFFVLLGKEGLSIGLTLSISVVNAVIVGGLAYALFIHIKTKILSRSWLKPYIIVEQTDVALLFGEIPDDCVHLAEVELLSFGKNLSLLSREESYRMFQCTLAAI